MIGASLATRYGAGITGPRTGLCMRHGCCRVGTARAHALRVQTAFRTLLLRTFDCAANAKINLRCIQVFSVYSLPVVEFML